MAIDHALEHIFEVGIGLLFCTPSERDLSKSSTNLKIGLAVRVPRGRKEEGGLAMATLRQGSRGEEVKRLQSRLKELGFSPGAIDGDFGSATDAAVRAFQASEELCQTK